MNSFRSSAWRMRSSAPGSAPGQKTLPITDASCRSAFSSGASPSIRAAIRPCTVSGSARLAALVLGEHPRVLLGVERVALGAPQHRLLRVGVEHGAVEQPLEEDGGLVVAERADREREGVALAAAPARPPVEQLRVAPSPTMRSGTVVAQSARWSTKSSRPSSAQWRSSNTSTSGRCSAAASSSRRHAANASSRSARSAPSRPTRGRVWRDEPIPLGLVLGERLDHRVELLLRRRGVVGLEDPGVRLDDLAERPEAHALAVREGAALPPGDDLLVGVGDLEQLGDEAALADAGHADERDELRRLLRARPRQRVGEEVALALPPDERRPQLLLDVAAEARAGADRLPHLDRLGFPLRLDRRRVAVVDRVARGAVRPFADEDPVDRRRALQPRGRVDDVAGDHRVALAGLRSERDERLAGVDGGADLQLLADRVADRERRPHRALGVVLVRDRRAEDGHHRVADELLDRAAVPLELGAELRVVGGERRADVLRVEPFGAARRAHEVGEEDRHDLPLFARGRARPARARRRTSRRSGSSRDSPGRRRDT